MRNRALSPRLSLPLLAPELWLALAAVAGWLLYAEAASADSLSVTEYQNCGAPPGYNEVRCYFLDGNSPGGGLSITTTYDNPDREWTIDPIHPEDPENWRLVSFNVGFWSNVTFGFVYPSPGPYGSASIDASFTDSQGRVLLNDSRSLGDGCLAPTSGPYLGKWLCTGGDGIGPPYVASFGEFGDAPPDPILPSLDGPITLRLDWSVYGPAPESSAMTVNSIYLYYYYELVAVPEPSTGLLVMTGLFGLAYQKRRHGLAA
jgi:hypothetical protein